MDETGRGDRTNAAHPRETVIEGIKTSIPMHLRILNDPDFQAGRLGTSFMDRFMTERKKPGDGRLAEAV